MTNINKRRDGVDQELYNAWIIKLRKTTTKHVAAITGLSYTTLNNAFKHGIASAETAQKINEYFTKN